MNDMGSGQAVAARDPCLPYWTAAQHTTFGQQFWPCGPMDRPIHAASTQQRTVSGIDDRIRLATGDVASSDFPAGGAEDHVTALAMSYIRSITLENPEEFLLLLLFFPGVGLAGLFL